MDLAMYIHVPFCVRKCHYCDFFSVPQRGELVAAYLEGLEKELELYSRRFSGSRVRTLYVGGGTPTCLSTSQLAGLFSACQRFFPFQESGEVTVEANPGTISQEKMKVLGELGVNRVSLGVQSFQARELASLGRIHRVEDIYRSYEIVRRTGFANISLDLIFGLPRQTFKDWEDNLERALALAPEHLSAYNLLIEEGTPFFDWREEGQLSLPCEDLEVAMFNHGLAKLQAAGYGHYEISNFALRGLECRHNLVYWHNEPYLGLGPGAHSFVEGVRWSNVTSLQDYWERLEAGFLPVAERESIPLALEQAETVILGLRLIEGIDRERFQKRFGLDLCELYPQQVKRLIEQGLLEISPQGVRLTAKGILLANRAFLEFLPEENNCHRP